MCVPGPVAAAAPFPFAPLQVLLDLREECEKYGSVSDVVVPRPAEPSRAKELWGTANYGKVGESGWGASQQHPRCAQSCVSLRGVGKLGAGGGGDYLHRCK